MGRQKTGRIGMPKLLYLPTLIVDMIKDYSNLLGTPQSAIVAEMISLGDAKFREKHNVEGLKNSEKSNEPLEMQTIDKGKQISEAYMRRILDKDYVNGYSEQ